MKKEPALAIPSVVVAFVVKPVDAKNVTTPGKNYESGTKMLGVQKSGKTWNQKIVGIW